MIEGRVNGITIERRSRLGSVSSVESGFKEMDYLAPMACRILLRPNQAEVSQPPLARDSLLAFGIFSDPIPPISSHPPKS